MGAEGSLQTNWFRSQFAAGVVKKEYYCLCEGPSLGEVGVRGEVDLPLLTSEVEGGEGGLVSRSEVSEYGRRAFTEYEVRRRFRCPELQQAPEDELMFLSVRPRTGRTHQIRVHMASLGRPLVGDFYLWQAIRDVRALLPTVVPPLPQNSACRRRGRSVPEQGRHHRGSPSRAAESPQMGHRLTIRWPASEHG